MSAREFLPVLREVEGRLSVPIPERVRILRELESDLEELRTCLMANGLSAGEARSRAIEALIPGGVALQQLDVLHASVYRRITHNLREDRLRLLERTALALATAAVLAVETLFLVRGGTFRIAPHLTWLVLGVGALLFVTVVVNAFQLWIKGDHRPLPFGLGAILGLAGVGLFVGLSSAFVDSYQLTATLEASPEMAEILIPQWLLRNAALLSVSIVIALAGGLAWFVMTQWLTAVSAARRDVLGLDPSKNSEGDTNHA